MKIKRIRKLELSGQTFDIHWESSLDGARFSFGENILQIGTAQPTRIWSNIVHEISEMVFAGIYCRHQRGDIYDDYIFVYDHRQHSAASEMIASALAKFIQ